MSKKNWAVMSAFAAVAIGAVSLAGISLVGIPVAKAADEAKPDSIDIKLPPGWTMEDMQACMAAGMPGEMHKKMAEDVGTWKGTSKMWMAPGAEPVESESKIVISPVFDGRYYKGEMTGEIPGMGPYNGLGIVGYDNVSGQFQGTWCDNHSTGIAFGTGKLSEDGKTLNWKYEYFCPITKKPTVLRQVETFGGDKKTIDMFGTDPKSGKEFQMMKIEVTKQ